MLRNTFIHIPGVGSRTERTLWASGVLSWDEVLASRRLPMPDHRRSSLRAQVDESARFLEAGDAQYFAKRLPSNQVWRLFPEFQRSVAYLDIETTGLGGSGVHITTIVLYDGRRIRHYVYGENLDCFAEDIRGYKLLVTYNGRCFDVPFIRNHLRIPMDQVHIDLRYVLRSLGYAGGLKGCERHLGIDRGELEGLDGFFAVLLWADFVRNENPNALETLLAYNVQDVVNLEPLTVIAYNLNLKETPFEEDRRLPMPSPPEIPFRADRETIQRIRLSHEMTSRW